MKKEFKKMINEVIEGIDWERIYKLYEDRILTWIPDNKIGLRSLKQIIPTISDLKDELRKILYYTIEEDLSEFSYSHWTVFWDNDSIIDDDDEEIGNSFLEVLFSPIRFSISENNMEGIHEINDDFNMTPEHELDLLKLALQEALEDEDYLLCAKYRDSIEKLEKSLKKKTTKKNEEEKDK